MAKLRGAKDGVPFEKGVSGNPNGRPKSVRTLLKEAGFYFLDADERLSIEDKRDLYELVQATPREDLMARFISNKVKSKGGVVTDVAVKGIPSIMVIYAMAILKDINEGSVKNIQQIELVLYGKTTDPQTVVNNNFAPVIVEVAGATRPPITSEDDIDD